MSTPHPQVILPDFFRGESRVGLTSFSLRRNISFSLFFINSFLGRKDLINSIKDQISYMFLEGNVERFAPQDVSSPDLGDWLKGQSNWWAPTLTRALTKKIIFNWIICNWTTHSTISSEKNHLRSSLFFQSAIVIGLSCSLEKCVSHTWLKEYFFPPISLTIMAINKM